MEASKVPEANLRFGFGFIYNLVWLSNRSKYDWSRYKNTEPSYFCGVGKVYISLSLICGYPLLAIKFNQDYRTAGCSKHC